MVGRDTEVDASDAGLGLWPAAASGALGRRHTAKPKQRAVPSRSPLAGGQLPTEFADHLRDVCAIDDEALVRQVPSAQGARLDAKHVEAPRRAVRPNGIRDELPTKVIGRLTHESDCGAV
jgi:hypothetical protein